MLKNTEMPPPDAKVMYGDNMFGPAMFHYALTEEGNDHYEQIAREHGFEIQMLTMEDDLGYDDDHPLMKAYAAGECAAVFAEWKPIKQKDGWELAGVHDTEDGPVALFLRCLKKPSSE